MRSQFKDCYNCAIETMQVLNKIYNQKKKKMLMNATCQNCEREQIIMLLFLDIKY